MSKLFYKGKIGEIYDDKIIVENKNIQYNNVFSIAIEDRIDMTLNGFFLMLALLLFIIPHIFFFDSMNFYLFMLLCFTSILISIFLNYKKQYLIVHFLVEETMEFKIKQKDIKEANYFLNLALKTMESERHYMCSNI